MKASFRWLCELLPTLAASPAEIAERLTSGGLEVEGTSRFGEASERALVARVVSREPHPSRPKLGLVTVEAGGGRTERVVCGAPNVPEPGGLVVLAPLGTRMHGGLVLERRDIGGVPSEGMLCSEAELGLRATGGGEGILVLPAGIAEPGTTFARAVPGSSDTIFEIGLTPNRPDGLGHLGLAREIAALCAIPFEPARSRRARTSTDLDVMKAVTIEIADPERCPIYGAALIEGVRVGPSPLSWQYRLEALGVRAISNVVDVTNLVMLLFGHPIHGFDLDRVRGRAIVVRRAAEGERMTTLDGTARTLVPDDLVIADGEGPVALAGVMGGAGSEIAETTMRVLVECAYFTPRGVRRTSRRHGLHTESSHRFERGVDPSDVEDALGAASAMLCELAGGTAAPSTLVVGPGVGERAPIRLRQQRLDALLGHSVPLARAADLLARLGCRELPGSEGERTFVPPHHRPDLAIEVDLVEEVMRLDGIANVPTVVPAIRPEAPRRTLALERRVTRAATEVGLSQALTFAFTSARELALIGAPEGTFVLQNPLGEERSVMRTSLFPGLFEALRRARRHGVADVRLFAVGARFLARGGAKAGEPESPAHEPSTFAAVLAGGRDQVLAKPEPLDVYDAKGLALAIIERATGHRATIDAQSADQRSLHLHPRAAADILIEGRKVGTLGVVHPEVEQRLDLGGPALAIELDLASLEAIGPRKPRYRPLPTLPASTRDLAVVVHDDVRAGEVEGTIQEAGGELVEAVELFDLFRGGQVPADHRSLAFHVVYRDPKAATDPERARTLTDAEVDQRHGAIVKTVTERFGARLRA